MDRLTMGLTHTLGLTFYLTDPYLEGLSGAYPHLMCYYSNVITLPLLLVSDI
jgi:hypothetical protein